MEEFVKQKFAVSQKGIKKNLHTQHCEKKLAKQNTKEKINCSTIYVTRSMTLNLRRNNKIVNTLNATDDWTVENKQKMDLKPNDSFIYTVTGSIIFLYSIVIVLALYMFIKLKLLLW